MKIGNVFNLKSLIIRGTLRLVLEILRVGLNNILFVKSQALEV